MSRPIIEVTNISKRYRLGQIGMTSLKDDLERLWGRIRGTDKNADGAPSAGEVARQSRDFWALRGVSFTVQPGAVVGIIGRNGAGKSTLLKILSRITEPTTGEVRLRGRVGSLLEVGTGFHPELSGRDNIYLNGAILGMSRDETAKKFEEIVAFSEVGKFIDTPVKRYSSGMYVRLAFAVAAHLEPEILIIDEVLAVGDAAFQRKCLGKMNAVAHDTGRTILFVSHNMAAVSQLTQLSVVLSGGKVIFDGATSKAIERYVDEFENSLSRTYDVATTARRWAGSGEAHVQTISFLRDTPIFQHLDDIEFELTFLASKPVDALRISGTVFSGEGSPVGGSFSDEVPVSVQTGERHTVRVSLPCPKLAPGRYHFDLAIGRGDFTGIRTEYDIVSDVLRFEVLPPKTAGGNLARWESGWGRLVLPPLQLARG